MKYELSRSLHALTARADRAADRILRAEEDVSYSPFLTLYAVSELGVATQRGVAEWMGLSEPSVSRMTRVLVAAGLLDAPLDPSGGNRRRLELTLSGPQLMDRCGALLENRFAALVREAGVPYADYLAWTQQLLNALTRGIPDGSSDAHRHAAAST